MRLAPELLLLTKLNGLGHVISVKKLFMLLCTSIPPESSKQETLLQLLNQYFFQALINRERFDLFITFGGMTDVWPLLYMVREIVDFHSSAEVPGLLKFLE